LKGHGFSRAANAAKSVTALAAEGRLLWPISHLRRNFRSALRGFSPVFKQKMAELVQKAAKIVAFQALRADPPLRLQSSMVRIRTQKG
jgi:hypothetical protein